MATKIKNVHLSGATNGITLSYDIYDSPLSGSTYDGDRFVKQETILYLLKDKYKCMDRYIELLKESCVIEDENEQEEKEEKE